MQQAFHGLKIAIVRTDEFEEQVPCGAIGGRHRGAAHDAVGIVRWILLGIECEHALDVDAGAGQIAILV